MNTTIKDKAKKVVQLTLTSYRMVIVFLRDADVRNESR